MKFAILTLLLLVSGIANAQILFEENFSDVSNWSVIENENGSGSFVTDGEFATLTMDNVNYATRVQDVGVGRVVPLDRTGHMEIIISELTDGHQRVFVHVEEFRKTSATNFTYYRQTLVLPAQTVAGTYTINFSTISWLANTTHVRFRIGGENWSAQQGTIKVDKLTYFGYASKTNVWNGNVSTEWNDANNWSQLQVPTTVLHDYVIIPQTTRKPILATTASIGTLTVMEGAKLTITAAGTLSISGIVTQNGTLENRGTINFNGTSQTITGNLTSDGVVAVKTGCTLQTNGNLILNPTGALLHGTGTVGGGGTVTGNITFKQVGSSANNVYNYWSSPVDSILVSRLSSIVYAYNPALATPALRNGWVNASGYVEKGKGYAAIGAGTQYLTGKANQGNVQVTVSTANGGNNLLGNPYPSSIDYNAFMVANAANAANLQGTLYFWDDDRSGGAGYSNSDYSCYNAAGYVSGSGNGRQSNGYIAPGQGFFVKALNNGTVEFTNAMRSGNSGNFFKQMDFAKLKLQVVADDSTFNEILVAFTPEATAGYDRLYDAIKIKGNQKLALYSVLDTMALAIQGLPVLDTVRNVELTLETAAAGYYTFNVSALESFQSADLVFLEDRLENRMINLANNPEYRFHTAGGIVAGRFALHFVPAPIITASNNGCTAGNGSIDMAGVYHAWNIEIANEHDSVIYSAPANGINASVQQLFEGDYKLTLADSTGMEIVVDVTVPAGNYISAEFTAPTSIAVGEELLLDNLSSGAVAYEWSFGDGSVSDGEEPFYQFDSAGVYTITLTATNGDCQATFSKDVMVTEQLTGIGEVVQNQGLKAWATDHGIEIRVNGSNQPLEVFDLQGRMMWQQPTVSSKAMVVTDAWATGLYIVRTTTNGKPETVKVMVK